MLNILNLIKYLYLKPIIGKISLSTKLEFDVHIKHKKNLFLGKEVKISNNVFLQAHPQIKIDDYTVVNAYSVIMGKVEIGKHCLVAPHVSIVGGNHNFDRLDVPIMYQGSTERGVVVGDNVWIGVNVVVLDGVKIGSGAIVGAGSVVTKNVASNTIVAGNPARVVRKRTHTDKQYKKIASKHW